MAVSRKSIYERIQNFLQSHVDGTSMTYAEKQTQTPKPLWTMFCNVGSHKEEKSNIWQYRIV
ncbi:hypothetical protein BK130_14040 [Viridibacillus sp. FSL H8-0123]|uniref:Uncharacterized protein n=1 Tax=Viridibacillus arenosi FSL R5-213 TaxID=1227360 RepID=W4F651_9BACL|nr:hypothetical protein C176_02463 [Viridibacillus arenosi FSL R5-213]OMC81780.1 hypothetical protein BK130_14040 [Viridibacillus sp. FSL H8-0123]OMC89055.1 hypothetical protein BK128_03750 [Viridibacillus sp. FSL H7-0596]OMC89788.1 hypothetical protein BK137_15425 [Viridibacillus arenosi]